jgi:Ca-activated chloride channel homolog
MGWKSALLPLLMAAVVPNVWAQTATPAPQSEVSQNQLADTEEIPLTTIRAQVQEVNVIFTATDRRGHYRKDLKSTDLAVLDDGKPPVHVNSFVSETDLPLRVGLVMDVSGSITARMAFEQESAVKFFNQILRPHTDKAFVLASDSVQRMPQDFTDDPAKLAAGVRSLTPGGGTALYDAIATAATKKLQAVKSDRPVRRVIILISDGEDNQSRVTRAEAIEAARRGEVTVYAISTNDSNVKTRGDKLLEQLADETGGRAFFPNKVEDVMHAFNTIQDELRSQYAVSYKPADFDADGHYRSILIMARSDKNVVIRARKGYFAPVR